MSEDELVFSDGSFETTLSGFDPEERAHPERIGPYRILRKISEGGMGEVYEAEQEAPVRRRVAIKLIRAGMSSRQVIARFESERQALALMKHPCISRIIDAGTTEEGRPFFAMEYVEGAPITRYADQQQLTTLERVKLFLQVCDAVQHAHQKGIIHRDIKPSNVLVEIEDGRPVARVIDFGIAKAIAQPLTQRTMHTELGQIIGTPEYMSPEQAEGNGLDVDTRTDVYSLGVLLYQLLTGRLPFDGKQEPESPGSREYLRRLLEDEPQRPSTRVDSLSRADSRTAAKRRRTESSSLSRQLRGDLDWITMKCLERDRTRRYGSAAQLAEDVRRHVRHDPVLAGPPSQWYRAGKFVRRHKAGVSFAAVLGLLLVGFSATMAVQRVQIAEQRDRANEQTAQAVQERETAREVSDYLIELFQVSDPGQSLGETITAREILDRGASTIDEELRDQPLLRARLMSVIATVYWRLGLEEPMGSLARRSLAIVPDDPHDSRPVVADNLTLLAHIDVGDGRYRVAEARYRRVLEIREAALGPSHPDVAPALTNLSAMLLVLGQRDEALRLMQRSLEIRRTVLGADHHLYAFGLANLARCALMAGDLDEARSRAEQALEIQLDTLGPRHPEVAATWHFLGDISAYTGEHDRARADYERALKLREEVLGPEHEEVAWTLLDLAMLCLREGNPAEAGRHWARGVEILDRLQLLDDPAVVYEMACYEALRGNRGAALQFLRRAVLGPGRFSGPFPEDPNLDPLRGDAEFEEIAAAVAARFAEDKRGP